MDMVRDKPSWHQLTLPPKGCRSRGGGTVLKDALWPDTSLLLLRITVIALGFATTAYIAQKNCLIIDN